ncbi:hypothetical protein [Arsenicicoccus piscis]|uniref:Primosomal protein N' 3' DNA-binding domain-containing protein n=1 Tax=Arsenicicoccus piscis TaxID=673954 RepID=A0ABQ6HNV7_9MICO|nr:hypothetical protein [Arsenicicoccus piscis]GMA19275.1 hypothetical protein GCM10025862_12960 [Arsenicicoccus piscis]
MSIDGEPLALVRAHMKGDRQVPTGAVVDPVARVLVDVPLAHLDRPFDYLVPEPLADQAVPGARVKVRFAGQDVDGFVVERVADTEHQGRLAPLRRVVSPEPVLTPEVLSLARWVARRYAGSVMDVVRLAVPPRHATAERAADARAAAGSAAESAAGPEAGSRVGSEAAPAVPTETAGATGWRDYRAGAAFLSHLASGGSPAASWLALPGTGDDAWPALVAEAARTALAAGRGCSSSPPTPATSTGSTSR